MTHTADLPDLAVIDAWLDGEPIASPDVDAVLSTAEGRAYAIDVLRLRRVCLHDPAPAPVVRWLDKHLHPPLEMFFAPSVLTQLIELWGSDELDAKCEAALSEFVDAAIDNRWIAVVRAEQPAAIQSEYLRIVEGTVPPSEAVLVTLAEGEPASTTESTAAVLG